MLVISNNNPLSKLQINDPVISQNDTQKLITLSYNLYNAIFSTDAPIPYHIQNLLYLSLGYMKESLLTSEKCILFPSAELVFNNAESFFQFIFTQIDNGYTEQVTYCSTLNFQHPYFFQIYKHYLKLLSIKSPIKRSYTKYLLEVYRLIPSHIQQHFTYPNSFFFYIDKNLIYNPDQNIFHHIETIGNILCHFGTPKITSKHINLIKSLQKFIAPEKYFSSAPKCSSNYSFRFSYENKLYYAFIHENSFKVASFSPPIIPQCAFTIDFMKYNQISLTETSINFLYTITGGSLSNLDIFSSLCAIVSTNYYSNLNYILSSKGHSPLMLFSILSSKEHLATIRLVLQTMYFKNCNDIIPINQLTKKEILKNLVNHNLNFQTGFIPVKPSTSQDSEIQIKTVRKIIARKNILIKNKAHFNSTLINHLPLICFVENQKNINYIRSIYKTKIFTFQHPKKNLPVSITINPEDLKILSYFLTIYGIGLLYNSDWSNNQLKLTNSNPKKDNETILEKFYQDILLFKEGSLIYADELYHTYEEYCNLFYTGEPLSRIMFVKEMRKLTSCEYKKPRRSRSDNRYAFIGLDFNHKNIAQIVSEDYKENILDKLLFSNHLNKLQSNINKQVDLIIKETLAMKKQKRVIRVSYNNNKK